MNNSKKSDTFSENDLLTLMNSVQNGDRAAEDKLLKAMEPVILPVVCNLLRADDKDPKVQDAVQGIKFCLIEGQRKGTREIRDPSGYIEKVARNYVYGILKKEKAQKRGPKYHEILDENMEDVALENRGVDWFVQQFMDKLPEDLREGIEKSLDIIADLFRMRSFLRGKLKRDSKHNKQILKPIKLIAEARKLIAKTRGHDPHDADLLRLRELREMRAPAFSGRPEEDKKAEEWLAEVRELEEKFGAALNLYEAQLELSAEISNTEVELLLAPAHLLDFESSYWIDYLPEIAGMKVSPLNLIYKVWSRAPGFRRAGSGKYRNRKEIEFALYSYKKTLKGTDREFLFSSIEDDTISSVEELEKKFDRFRKAGYGQALKKKYKPIVKLIYERSFGASNLSRSCALI